MLQSLARSCYFCALLLTLFSCGKEQKQAAEKNTPRLEPEQPQVEKQQVLCERSSCPNYIAKIMVMDEGKRKFCTGTLVSPTVLVTSTSCLPKSLRSPAVSCKGEAFFFFHKSSSGTPETVGCSKVLQVSELSDDLAALWHDDVAFLELAKPQYFKRQLAISRDGFEDNKEYEQISIDQVDEFTAYIRRKDCTSQFNTYISPLANDVSSPNMVMSGCDFKNGASGSPILDSKGRIRGIVSQSMSESFRKYILNESGMVLGQPLKSMLHVSSFACAPTIYDDYVLDERECGEPLTSSEMDAERKKMLNPDVVFKDIVPEVKKDLPINEYLEFGVRLLPFENYYTPEFYPVCFKFGSWIKRMKGVSEHNFTLSYSKMIFKKMIDADGKIGPHRTKGDKNEVKVYFSPKTVFNTNASYVTMIDKFGRIDYSSIPRCKE